MKIAKRVLSVLISVSMLLMSGCSSVQESSGSKYNTSVAEDTDTKNFQSVPLSDTYTFESISFNDYTAGCSKCEDSVQLLSSLLKAFNHIEAGDDSDNLYYRALEEIEKRIYPAMKHSCNVPVIYVENLPYAFQHNNGLYTGYWQGAGPCGEGHFHGYNRIDMTNAYYEYTGEWKYGLPDGAGESIEEIGFGGNFTFYSGEFSEGIRNGKGMMYQTINDKGRYYPETDWLNGNLAGESQIIEFLVDTEEFYGYGTAVADDFYINFTSYLSKKQITEAAKSAAFIAAIVIAAKLGDAIADSGKSETSASQTETPQNSVNQALEDEKKKQQELAEIDAAQKESYRQYSEYKRDQCIKAGDTWSTNYQYWNANSKK